MINATTPGLYGGFAENGRATFRFLERFFTEATESHRAAFKSTAKPTDPNRKDEKIAELETIVEEIGFTNLTAVQRRSLRDAQGHLAHLIGARKEDRRKALNEQAASDAGLAWMRRSCTDEVLTTLEQIGVAQPNKLLQLRAFLAHIREHWGGNPVQVQQQMSDELDSLGAVTDKQGLSSFFQKAQQLKLEIEKHYALYEDTPHATKLLAPRSDGAFIHFCRLRLSTECLKPQLQPLVDHMDADENEDMTLAELTKRIVKFCQKSVRTVDIKTSPDESKAQERLMTAQALVQDQAGTHAREMETAMRRIAALEAAALPAPFSANTAFGQDGMGMTGLAPRPAHPGVGYGGGYSGQGQGASGGAGLLCTFWDGAHCHYAGQCMRQSTHTPGVNHRAAFYAHLDNNKRQRL
jgi:hypothetical protein